MEIKFIGYKIRHKTFESEVPDRIVIDISDNELENVRDIVMKKLPRETLYEVTIKPIIEE